jgi:hypothetical protein
VWHRHDLDAANVEGRGDLVSAAVVEASKRGKVLIEPEALVLRIKGEQDLSPRDAAQLGQTSRPVPPVVNGEDRHGSVKGTVRERQRFGHASDPARSRMLVQHDRRRFQRDHEAICRFVGAGPCADVHDRGGVAQSGVDPSLDPGIGTTLVPIPTPNDVVG